MSVIAAPRMPSNPMITTAFEIVEIVPPKWPKFAVFTIFRSLLVSAKSLSMLLESTVAPSSSGLRGAC